MPTSRNTAGLLGLAFAVAASGAHAQDGYQDPYYQGAYESEDRYEGRYEDRRYDDRYDDRRSGARTIRCESRDRRSQHCNVDTRGGVRLVQQLSDRRCIRGSTWGSNERGIWVTDGCRGKFEIGASYLGNTGRRFRCESTNSRTRYCQADTRYGVHLVRQLSRSSCVEGRSWGRTRDSVWVSQGCRAEFAVGERRDGYDYDYGYR